MRDVPSRLLAVAAALAFAVYVLVSQGARDLWFDEIVSVNEFILVPPVTTVTSYPYPNNHILSNLLSGAWLRMVGVEDFAGVASAPLHLRWIPLAASLACIGYAWALVRRISDERGAALAVVLLCASPAFVSFAAQIRGYALSTMLCAATLHHLWTFTDGGRARHAVLAVLAGGLSVWTLPSDVYFLGGLGAAHVAAWIVARRPVSRDLPAAALCAAAAGIGLLCHAPVWDQLFGNSYAQTAGAFRWRTLYELAPAALARLADLPWQSLPWAAAAVLWFLRLRGAEGSAPLPHARSTLRRFVLFLAACTLPFALSFVRGDRPYDRTFACLAPALAAFAGCGLSTLPARTRDLLLIGGVIAACGVLSHRSVAGRLDADLDRDAVAQDLRASYFLAPTFDMKAVADTVAAARREGDIVVAHDIDRIAVGAYLRLRGVEALHPHRFAETLAAGGPVLAVTGMPGAFERGVTASGRSFQRLAMPRNRFSVYRIAPR